MASPRGAQGTRGGPVLALDVGDRRIGVAVSDPTGLLAGTAGWIDRRGPRQDLDAIRERLIQHGAVRLVVGLPLSLSGATGPQAQST